MNALFFGTGRFLFYCAVCVAQKSGPRVLGDGGEEPGTKAAAQGGKQNHGGRQHKREAPRWGSLPFCLRMIEEMQKPDAY